jgi:hypothetical protein
MTNRTRRQMGDAGVSEAIGFLLIFAMVIAGIGLVTVRVPDAVTATDRRR